MTRPASRGGIETHERVQRCFSAHRHEYGQAIAIEPERLHVPPELQAQRMGEITEIELAAQLAGRARACLQFEIYDSQRNLPVRVTEDALQGLAVRQSSQPVATGLTLEFFAVATDLQQLAQSVAEQRNRHVWLSDTELAFSMDVAAISEAPFTDYEGAIIAIDVEQAAGGPSADLTLIAGFEADQWVNRSSVTGLTTNAARDELLYSLEGDVHVINAPFDVEGSASHQLTTGSIPHFGAVFSPNGDEIAFVEYTREHASDIYVIPNHRGAAIDPGADQLVTRTNVQRLVGWLP